MKKILYLTLVALSLVACTAGTSTEVADGNDDSSTLDSLDNSAGKDSTDTTLDGDSSIATETLHEGITAIIQLFEAGDWDSLIRTRYAEIAKATDESQVVALISRYEKQFSDETSRNAAIAIYQAALLITPEYLDDGKTAHITTESGLMIFSVMEDGRWGFHI